MQFALDFLVSLVSLLVVGQFTWAVRGHFTSAKATLRAQAIAAAVVLVTLGFVFLQWARPQPFSAQIIGLIVELVGLALFWAAIKASRTAKLRFAFDPEHPKSLLTTGPYHYVRHPFYTSYLIFWIGWGVAVWSVWAILAVVVICALYVWAARTEEASFEATPFAADYAVYRRRAGLFWPRFKAGSTPDLPT